MKALGREGGRNMGFGLLTQMKTNYMHFWTTQHSHFLYLEFTVFLCGKG